MAGPKGEMTRFTCTVPVHMVRREVRLVNKVTGEVVEGEFKALMQYFTREGMLEPMDVWELTTL